MIASEKARYRRLGIVRHYVGQVKEALNFSRPDSPSRIEIEHVLPNAANLVANRQIKGKRAAQLELEVGDQVDKIVDVAIGSVA